MTRFAFPWFRISPHPEFAKDLLAPFIEYFKHEGKLMTILERIETALNGIKGDIARAYNENADLKRKNEDQANQIIAQASALADLQGQLDKIAADLETADDANKPDVGGSMGGITV